MAQKTRKKAKKAATTITHDDASRKNIATMPKSNLSNHADPLDGAILSLLRKLPLRWGPLDTDELTATEQEALKLLTAAAMVDRRASFRLRLIGHPINIDATITVTGEYGIVEAVEPVAQASWREWADEYTKQCNKPDGASPRFHCEKIGHEMLRLTDDGETARHEIQLSNAAMTLDFVRRRGSVFATRPAVYGYGRADTIRTEATASTPAEVKITNLSEIADPLANLASVVKKAFEGYAKDKPKPENTPDDQPEYSWAKQADLVRATNNVLCEGTLNKGSLSKAITQGEIKYNGKSGRACRVDVESFLVWITRKESIQNNETIQIRNAIIGELSRKP